MSPPTQPQFPAGLRTSEPIPGYRITELIGRGGYGEVWKAIAPGGIAKAMKIVFGGSTSHADTEMRALARIKDVRHPLLLSIERIEIVESNLLIVTELADCNLKERFVQARQGQLPGIPAHELLRYISDTAEALDFLYEQHSLQHLDVKPENILIVSGRGKLGDFGLVKNLYEHSVSLVGGLTPTFAPPELFEGKPNRHSDQYGLALVYMQMLTGLLPFTAINTAQLAAQHLHGVPDLSPLPRAQRPIIARALSKDPQQRFENCQAMVAALQEATRSGEQGESPETARPAQVRKPTASPAIPPRSQPPGDVSASRKSDSTPRRILPRGTGAEPPIILIGVGGAGTEVLAGVANRLHDRYGDSSAWPHVEMLALDTNVRFLMSRFREQDLERIQLVPIPLKPPEFYGENAAEHLRWISRRWLYNVSRDLSTGGFRPLGRLALLTHAEQVKQALRSVVERIQAAGIPPDVNPHVLLVSSTCGGTGSGAVLDLSFAIRAELKRSGFSDDYVHGVLLHLLPRSAHESDKSRANAYALLSELAHYSRAGGHYPGERLLEIPPFHGNNAVFSQTHLLKLGDCPNEAAWSFLTDQAAEFVYSASLTDARHALLDHIHTPGVEELSSPEASVYEIVSLGLDSARTVQHAAQAAIQDVLQMWREGRTAPPNLEATASLSATSLLAPLTKAHAAPLVDPHEIAARLKQCGLDLETLAADANRVLELEAQGTQAEFLERLVNDSLQVVSHNEPFRRTNLLALIDRYLGSDVREGIDADSEELLFAQVIGRLVTHARGRIKSLFDWITGLIEGPETRLGGASRFGQAALVSLQRIQREAQEHAAQLQHAQCVLASEARHETSAKPQRSFLGVFKQRTPDSESTLRSVLRYYAEISLEQLLYRAVAKVLRTYEAELSLMLEEVARLARDLGGLNKVLRGGDAQAPLPEEPTVGLTPAVMAYRRLLQGQLQLLRPDIANTIDAQIQQNLTAHGGVGLSRFLNPQIDLHRELTVTLNATARKVVLEHIQQVNCRLLSVEQGGVEEALGPLLSLIAGMTNGEQAADARTQLLIVPAEADSHALIERIHAKVPGVFVVPGRKCDISWCKRQERTPVCEQGEQIISGIDLFRELARRLHTRVDVEWQSLAHTPFPRVAASPSATQASGTPSRTAVIPLAVSTVQNPGG